LRHVTRRHNTLMHFGIGKNDVQCCACRTAQRDTIVTTSTKVATRTTRVHGRRHRVDWGVHVHLTFSRSCCWDRCKSRALNLYTRALLLLCRPPCRNKHCVTRSSRRARHALRRAYRVVTWHNKWNLGLRKQNLGDDVITKTAVVCFKLHHECNIYHAFVYYLILYQPWFNSGCFSICVLCATTWWWNKVYRHNFRVATYCFVLSWVPAYSPAAKSKLWQNILLFGEIMKLGALVGDPCRIIFQLGPNSKTPPGGLHIDVNMAAILDIL